MSTPAAWWTKAEDGVVCNLCFHNCHLSEGKTGYCGARRCVDSALESPYLGLFSAMAVDPIEKKPLRHWQPGSFIFSLGSAGCTMRCQFCQNFNIAQPVKFLPPLSPLSIEDMVAKVNELGLKSVAYTYNEPTLQAEYIVKAAPVLRESGIGTVLVTNCMFSEAALSEILPFIDAANVDIKTFNPPQYAKLGGSLETVLRNVKNMAEAGLHVEITNLIVPTVSDSPEEFSALVEFVSNINPEIPLHISRYFPANKFTHPATPVALLNRFKSIAETRLKNVYVGNVR